MGAAREMVPALPRRDLLWEDCRNSLGIARLLCREGRPQPLVSTACRMAVETACRAALEHAGVTFEGDLDASVRRLRAAEGLEPLDVAVTGSDLDSTERTMALVAQYLRRVAPERHWGF